MGHIVNATVSYMHLTNLTDDMPAYADVRIRSNLDLPHRTAEEIGWAVLEKQSGIETLILRGLLQAAVHVYEIRPPWERGWPEYLLAFRATDPVPLDIEPLIKDTTQP
jgi:hypothetical protein